MTESAIGRAKTVLVFGSGEDARATVTSVVARIKESDKVEPLSFVGPGEFERSTRNHIRDVVLPLTAQIMKFLDCDVPCLELSIVNLGAASSLDVGLRVTGFSADAAVLLALLSAALEIPIPQDLLSTGHIASPAGDIRLVRNLPTKLQAAVADPAIRIFLVPDLDIDTSLQILTPQEKDRAAEAIAEPQRNLQVISVTSVLDLFRSTLSEETLVLAGLRKGFFNLRIKEQMPPEVQFLLQGSQDRFWKSVERYLFAGNGHSLQELLSEFCKYHLDKESYPEGFGQRLYQTAGSLPPATRRLRTSFPLLPISECLELSRYAKESDHQDVLHLLDVVSGKSFRKSVSTKEQTSEFSPCGVESNPTLETILSEIGQENLAQKIALPIDNARACFWMEEVTLHSYEDFIETLRAFYVHLLGHAEIRAVNEEAAGGDVLSLLERAFREKGGSAAAWLEAKEGIHGGMRFVLDALTEQFKLEQQGNHILRVLKEALDPLDWDGRTALMKALLGRLDLPEDLSSEPPERFARHYEIIVQEYLKSFDRVKQLLRTL